MTMRFLHQKPANKLKWSRNNILIVLPGLGAAMLAIGVLLAPLPNPLFQGPYAQTLYADNGSLLNVLIAADEQWRFPPTDSVPRKFEVALLLFEDEYFYDHWGFNPISLLRAARQNIKAGAIVSGGSTITMQTVRLARGNLQRTYGQKFLEILAAVKLEARSSKQEILQAYTDHAPFGSNIVGLSAASHKYFGVPPHQLSWAESCMLAVLPNDPAEIFPGKAGGRLLSKRNRLLRKLHEKGYIDDDALELSLAEDVPSEILPTPKLAYHLLHRSVHELGSGKNIKTTIDVIMQERVERKLAAHSNRLAENYIHNAAAVVIDIESGATLAYVGNSNNDGSHGQHVDVVRALRSPGSLLKPFLYAFALDEGLILPDQLLKDMPSFYEGFAPKNFDKRFRGAVPASEALRRSLNVPFVQLLAEFGQEKFLLKLKEIGFVNFSKPPEHYGLSLILGGAETSLWEVTSVYASLARAIKNYPERPLNRGYSSTDYRVNHYLLQKEMPEENLHREGPIQVASIQHTLHALLGLERPFQEEGWRRFQSSRAIAWKTGTSYGFRDGWAVGLNDEYVVGVWVGNADGEGRPGLTGVHSAAPLMFDIFNSIPGRGLRSETFGGSVLVCQQSGMRSSDICTDVKEQSLPDYMLRGPECQYHRMLVLDQAGQFQVTSDCHDLRFSQQVPWFVLPAAQATYFKSTNPGYSDPPPLKIGCNHAAVASFELVYPGRNASIKIPREQDGGRGRAIFEAAHFDAQATIYWHLDDDYLGQTSGRHQIDVFTTPGTHELTLVDQMGNERSRTFEVSH